MGSTDRLRAHGVALVLVAASLAIACASTEQVREEVEPSGFLGDYSELEEGAEEEAALVFIRTDTSFHDFSKIEIDPITIWHGSSLDEVPEEELQRLADHLDTALREQLGRHFELVERASPGTLRLRVAITEAVGSRVVLDIASTVLPPARLLSEVKRLTTGTQAFVGKAAIELEILDALSGERLIAAVDMRAGTKTLRGSTSTWSAVEEAFDYWATRLASRLVLLRDFDGSEPVAPPEPAE